MKPARYNTCDLALAAYLKVRGLRLLEIVPAKSGRADFSFQNSDETQDLVLRFLNGDGAVDAARFAEAMKTLRSLALQAVRGSDLREGTHA